MISYRVCKNNKEFEMWQETEYPIIIGVVPYISSIDIYQNHEGREQSGFTDISVFVTYQKIS